MSPVTTTRDLDPDGVAAALVPWHGLVEEEVGATATDSTGTTTTTFAAARGPVGSWHRTVTVDPQAADGTSRVAQAVDWQLDLPGFTWLFRRPFRREVRRLPLRPSPWWAPPSALDARAARTTCALAVAAYVCGYLGTLITQTITFAGKEFDVGSSGQGVALAVLRADIAIAFAVVALGDRVGRRPVLLVGAAGAIAATFAGALAPALPWLVAAQIPARGLTAAVAITIGVVAAEEVPAGSRAWTASILAMTAGAGSGLCVLTLPLADLGPRGWRLSFLVPVVFLYPLWKSRRWLVESRRFASHRRDVDPRSGVAKVTMRGHYGRLVLLGGGALLTALFLTPAGQLQNTFLQDERGYTALKITIFSLVTGTPGGIGVVLGGRLADVRGRRVVGAVGLVGGTALYTTAYLTSGPTLWLTAVVGSVLAGATVPALAVYGPELFPTALRGRANGIISGMGRAGSVVGLLAAGFLTDRLGGLGRALALLALGPLVLAALIVFRYPETAGEELEALNPEDVVVGAPVPT